ncbi:hypothetical protein I7I50_00123 [Histoplasma capsulatum G186AR]|uniref:Uncharacterized protein n=1 Tax=Ajellomyces capsulatus TaxID=5037 RepID=A0A8H8CUL2_AJECA|nr:hypothetical protein I7I52_07392 [Histoplasma capsulatum]QSS72314.1 hypothetical protein I7I50_00123 [Histoplasma capsulatum G186AR]
MLQGAPYFSPPGHGVSVDAKILSRRCQHILSTNTNRQPKTRPPITMSTVSTPWGRNYRSYDRNKNCDPSVLTGRDNNGPHGPGLAPTPHSCSW